MANADIRDHFLIEVLDHDLLSNEEEAEYTDALLEALATLGGAPLAFRAAAFQALKREPMNDYERTLATFPVPEKKKNQALSLAAAAFVYAHENPDTFHLPRLLSDVYEMVTLMTMAQFRHANQVLDGQSGGTTSYLDPSWPVWMTRQLAEGLGEADWLSNDTPEEAMQKAHEAFLEGKEVFQVIPPMPDMHETSWVLLLTAMAVMDCRCSNTLYGDLLLLCEDVLRLERDKVVPD